MKDSKKKAQKSNSWIFLLLICISTCFMGIGFAQINTLLEITGTAVTDPQDNIFITEVNYVGNVGANLNSSEILNTYQTILNSDITLSATDPNSTITYEVVVYNSTDSDYEYKRTSYMLGNDTYDNENIAFRLNGISEGDVLKSKQSIRFTITFYYKNNTVPADNQLKSFINFEFEQHVALVSAGTLINIKNESNGIFGSTLSKSSVEKICFVDYETTPAGASAVWDASTNGNYAITGWAIDEDQNGMLEIFLGADNGKISLPMDSSYIFATYTYLKSIDFHNIDTSKVTDMSYMFYYDQSLTQVDASNFDTSNVTNMAGLFYYAMALKSVNVSSFNTSKVVNMSNMFNFDYNLTELDLSSFDTANVTNMNYMFYYLMNLKTLKLNNATFNPSLSASATFTYIPSSVYIIAKDNDARNWIQTQLGSGKGTIVTVSEL